MFGYILKTFGYGKLENSGKKRSSTIVRLLKDKKKLDIKDIKYCITII